jgi:hypothetical protein
MSSIIKNTPTPRPKKTAIKYSAPNPIRIFMAKLVWKEAALIKDFHSKEINCNIML